MAKDKITFLTEVELPPYCFMSEAVEWVAFGRVPQMQHQVDDKSDEVVDYRFYCREMPDNFESSFEFPWFDRLEFGSLGIPITESYFKAAEKCCFQGVDHLPDQIAEYESKEDVLIDQGDGSVKTFTNVWRQTVVKNWPNWARYKPLSIKLKVSSSRFMM